MELKLATIVSCSILCLYILIAMIASSQSELEANKNDNEIHIKPYVLEAAKDSDRRSIIDQLVNASKKKKQSREDKAYRCPKDPSKLKVLNPERPKVALISVPGSGNTWVRHLLQIATGYQTGSFARRNGKL